MESNLLKSHPFKAILYFATPLLIGNIFQQFYNVVDSIVIGRYEGYKALAAVGQAFPILLIFVSLIIGFGIAANIILGQYIGAKKYEKIQTLVDTNLITHMIFSLVVLVLGLIFSSSFLRLINTPEDIFESANLYLKIIFIGIIPTFAYNGLSSLFRGFGNSKTPLYALIISTLINIVLDIVFVAYYKMGVLGVGLATLISQIFSFIYLVVQVKRGIEPLLKINWFHLKFDKLIFKKIFYIGIPMSIQQALIGLGLTTMVGFVNNFGAQAAAAYSAASKIDGFAFLPTMSIGLALSTFSAQNIGARRLDRVKSGLSYGILISLSSTIILGTIIILFSKPLLSLFINESSNVIKLGQEYLNIVMPSYIFQTLVFAYMGVIRGSGQTIVPLFVSILSLWVFRLPVAYILINFFGFGLSGIWWGMGAGYFMGMTYIMIYYYFGSWKKKSLL